VRPPRIPKLCTRALRRPCTACGGRIVHTRACAGTRNPGHTASAFRIACADWSLVLAHRSCARARRREAGRKQRHGEWRQASSNTPAAMICNCQLALDQPPTPLGIRLATRDRARLESTRPLYGRLNGRLNGNHERHGSTQLLAARAAAASALRPQEAGGAFFSSSFCTSAVS